MVNIHALGDIVAVDHPVHGHIVVDPDLKTINVPRELAEELLRIHVDGVPLWESEVDHQRRGAAAELERKRDPAQQALLLSQLVDLAKAQAALQGINIDELTDKLQAPAGPEVPEHQAPAPDADAEAAKLAAAIEAKDYDVIGRNDLSKLAGSRGLNGGGTKQELVQRLRDQDTGRQ